MAESTMQHPAEAASLRPSEAAEALGISTATLRRWSRRFESFLYLNNGARNEKISQRRYSPDDLETLQQIKTLLDEGQTYDQVADDLRNGQKVADEAESAGEADDSPAVEGVEEGEGDEPALDLVEAAESTLESGDDPPPALRFLQDTLQSLSDSQQLVLNSQQANRDMLGVMIQDNLNLKNENTRLRDRMLHQERELAELRRHHDEYRRETETRIRVLEDAVSTLMAQRQPARSPKPAPSAPRQASSQQPERRSFWSRLIGG